MASMIMNLMPTMSTSFSSPSPSSTGSPSLAKLPVKSIPGSYGLPVLGPIADRLDYFWFQGPQTFLKKRMEKYNSTVFRTNVPPTFPFYLNVNPQMIAVLDCMAFTSLFDMEVVEKKNILIGDFMPSLSFTGDIRVGVYLDPTEPQHAQVKDYSMDILKRSSKVWTAEFQSNIDHMWSTLESNLSSSAKGEASYVEPLQKCLFRFLTKSIIGADPQSSPEIGEKGHIFLDLWLALQILPTTKIGILQPLEEIFLHSFPYPSWLVKGGYNKLCEFVKTKGDETVQRGVTEFGLTQDEAIHNLLFILGFNAFGGFSIFLPSVLTTLGDKNNGGIRDRLRKEVREIAGSTRLSFDSVSKMELVKSFVYETLRLNPPVSSQFARARKDFVLNSHASAFQVKKGELLFGYQPIAMRDPKVFEDPETFVPDRFAKNKGLLDYLFWSNGPETGSPSSSNKQCAGKDYVVLTACMFVADLFQRFDSIQVSSTSITVIEKAK